MSWVMVDVEADGPVPGLYSMTEFGAVIVQPGFKDTFYGSLAPISDKWIPRALAVTGKSREEVLKFPEPQGIMEMFANWLKYHAGDKPCFISDNNGFDWQFINWYFHKFTGDNPFGHSSTNLGSLYKGMKMNMKKNFKKLRKTKHTHHPVDDAMGNTEALLQMKEMGLQIKL